MRRQTLLLAQVGVRGLCRNGVRVNLGKRHASQRPSGIGLVTDAVFAGYSGQAFSLAGDKGRYVLPPPFRKAVIESSDGNTLCLAKHDRWKCLVGFGLSRRQELEQQLDREEAAAMSRDRDFDRETRAMQLNGFVEFPFDKSGRFVLLDYLRELAGIDDCLFFQGAGRFFTVWNPRHLQEMGDDWAAAKAACAALSADVRSKAK